MKITSSVPTSRRPACTTMLAIIAFAAAGCRDNKENEKSKDTGGSSSASISKYPGTEAGAKEMLSAFLKPGADLKNLTMSLRPSKADYAAVFSADLAAKVAALYDPGWEAGALVLTPKEGQTELMLQSVPSAEIRAWSPAASRALPGGYEKIKDQIKDGLTVYAFKFVKPGESSGMAYDGLVHVNGQWRIFPKPWRAAP